MAAHSTSILNAIAHQTAAVVTVGDVTLAALRGAFEEHYTTMPSLRGLRAFALRTEQFVASGAASASGAIERSQNALSALLALSSPNALYGARLSAFDAQGLRETAVDAFEITLRQAANALVRLYRDMLVSKSPYGAGDGELMRITVRNGNRIRANDALQLIARKALLDHVNQAHIEILRSAGLDIAVTTHPEPTHMHAGRVITLTGAAGMDTYADLVARNVFHPQSRVLIGAP